MGDDVAITVALVSGVAGLLTTALTVVGSLKKQGSESVQWIADERQAENDALRSEVETLRRMLSDARKKIRELDGDTGPFYPVNN